MYSYDYHIPKGLAYRFKLINLYHHNVVGFININLSRLRNHKYNTYVKIDINTKKNNYFCDFKGYKLLSSLEFEIYNLLDYVFLPNVFVNKVLSIFIDCSGYMLFECEVKNNLVK